VDRKCILAEIVKDYSDFQPTGIALWRQVLVMLLRFVAISSFYFAFVQSRSFCFLGAAVLCRLVLRLPELKRNFQVPFLLFIQDIFIYVAMRTSMK
jgi:hypothetical protein